MVKKWLFLPQIFSQIFIFVTPVQTSAFFWEFSHFFENFCILDFQTNRIKKNSIWTLKTVVDVFWRDFPIFFWIFSSILWCCSEILQKKNSQKKETKFWLIFLRNFFLRKNQKFGWNLETKFKKKFGNHVKVRHQPFPIFNFEFFLFTWSENPKYKNSKKNEKILKKTR